MGAITPLGNSVQATWDALLAGQSGIAMIEEFDASAYSTRFGGLIKNFNIEDFMPLREARRMDEFLHYGIAAGMQAMADAGFGEAGYSPHRTGVAIGSGIGGITNIENTVELIREKGPRKVSPYFVPGSIINMVAGTLSIEFNLKGPNLAVSTACTTGTHCIGLAARMIAYGDADVMVAGGAEKSISKAGLGGFCAARALSTRNDDPTAASRPWDADRDGFVLSDGAGILVLEEYEAAKKRNATIYAEVTGFGMSADAFHITSPSENGEGAAHCMQHALDDAGLNADQIQYINAHGTSTLAGDIAETMAIKKVFAGHCDNLAISSLKSMIGHSLGATGAIEAIFSIRSLQENVAPPTINLDEPGAGCDLDYVPNTARDIAMTAVMSNSFGFGGTNGSLIFTRV
jgi:3-oxoacyl-[acyl-carrier-protein] synthase II